MIIVRRTAIVAGALLLAPLLAMTLASIPALAQSFSLGASALERARELYQKTEYQQALELLESAKDKNSEAHFLTGQCYYRLEEFKKATQSLEKAVAVDENNSVYYDWLGRAYGRRAETSSFFTAPSYAGKARRFFEQAVRLDPENLEAASDLFEYYLEAPGFLGGGKDKAADLAETILALSPAEYYQMQAKLAEKNKDFEKTEQMLREAVKAASSQAGRHIDLARFLARQGRYEESDQAFEQAAKVAPHAPKVKFERARSYVQSQRNLEEARQLLEQYLRVQLTPEDPPRADARRLLQQAARG